MVIVTERWGQKLGPQAIMPVPEQEIQGPENEAGNP